MMTDALFWSLIETIYAAAVDDRLWRTVLDLLIEVTDSQQACFFVLDSHVRSKLTTFEYQNFDPDGIKEYLNEMAAHDPNVQHLIAHPRQKILHEGSIITEAEKDRHIYYDWQSRWSDVRHRVVGSTSLMPKVQAGVALHRTRRRGDFSSTQIEQFRLIFGHVSRALEIGLCLCGIGPAQHAPSDILDGNRTAIVLLDKSGAVIFRNEAARELAVGGALVIASAGLALHRSSDNDQLQRLISAASSTSRKVGVGTGGTMLALQPSGRRWLSLLISPLSGRAFAPVHLRPAVCVAVAEVDKVDATMVGRAPQVCLSSREQEILTWMARGKTRKEVAIILSLADETVKDYLARAKQKLRAHNSPHAVAIALTHGLIRL